MWISEIREKAAKAKFFHEKGNLDFCNFVTQKKRIAVVSEIQNCDSVSWPMGITHFETPVKLVRDE
jgi:hypothetical protein